MENALIQKACLNYIDSIEAIYNEAIVWLDSQGIHQWKKDVYPTRKSALEALQYDSLYNGFIKGRLAGTFIINEQQACQYEGLDWKYKNGKVLVLHTLIIRPVETGQGLAKAIMEFVLEYARINNYASVRLDVFPGNKAAAGLYRSFGFEYVGKVFFDFKEPGYEWYDCYEKLIDKALKV